MSFTFFISFCLLFFSLNIIFSKNTVYSILSLIVVFIFSSVLLFSFGLDYIPLIFITIYVGALSVLFIFVIMMLHSKTYGTKNNSVFMFYLFLFSLSFLFLGHYDRCFFFNEVDFSLLDYGIKLNPIESLGLFMFTNHFIYVCLAASVLLIAMVGSVVLVLEPYKVLKNQRIYQQISRVSSNSYFKVK